MVPTAPVPSALLVASSLTCILQLFMSAIVSNSPPAKLSRLSIVGQICGVPVADGRNGGVPLAEADWLILTAGGRPLFVVPPLSASTVAVTRHPAKNAAKSCASLTRRTPAPAPCLYNGFRRDEPAIGGLRPAGPALEPFERPHSLF